MRISARAVRKWNRPSSAYSFARTRASISPAPIRCVKTYNCRPCDRAISTPPISDSSSRKWRPRLTVTPAIADGTLLEFRLCDMAEDAVEIRALPGELPVYGYMRIPCISVTSVRHKP